MSTFRLAHLSDPHLTPPVLPFRWRDLASKRLLSRFAWRRKRHRHSPEILDAIAADVRDSAPDHIVITGDLTNFATPEEFEAAAGWLRGLGEPSAVTVSPGNHDALVSHATPDRFAPWRPWLGDDPAGDFPQLRVRGPVAILNLCSAKPTAPHLAQGSLGPAQLDRLSALLRETKAEGLYRLLLVHHPVAAGSVSRRKALTDAAELRRVLAEAGAELVLHGHAHEPLLHRVKGPAGVIPVMGVPSASTPHGLHDPPARWHAIEVARKAGGFHTRIVARGVGPDRRIEALGAYALPT